MWTSEHQEVQTTVQQRYAHAPTHHPALSTTGFDLHYAHSWYYDYYAYYLYIIASMSILYTQGGDGCTCGCRQGGTTQAVHHRMLGRHLCPLRRWQLQQLQQHGVTPYWTTAFGRVRTAYICHQRAEKSRPRFGYPNTTLRKRHRTPTRPALVAACAPFTSAPRQLPC